MSASGTLAKASFRPGRCRINSDRLICNVWSATSGMADSASGRAPSAGPGSAAMTWTAPGKMEANAALILVSARLDEVSASDQLFNELTTGGLMYGQKCREVRHSESREALDLLQNPHLRTGKPAAFFHLAEILAHRAVDHAELLQNRQGNLRRGR